MGFVQNYHKIYFQIRFFKYWIRFTGYFKTYISDFGFCASIVGEVLSIVYLGRFSYSVWMCYRLYTYIGKGYDRWILICISIQLRLKGVNVPLIVELLPIVWPLDISTAPIGNRITQDLTFIALLSLLTLLHSNGRKLCFFLSKKLGFIKSFL